ncbi:MAG TPA: acyltransferase [Polyangiaceae bacterium]
MSERFSLLTPLGLGLVATALLAGFTGCKKDEPPPPLPSAAPAPTPTPTEQLTLVPEDAGAPVDAGDDAGKKTGGSGQSMAKCCAALASNAALAPSPNKEYMLAAAQACNVAVGAGQGAPAVLAAVQGALRGAGMPAACK